MDGLNSLSVLENDIQSLTQKVYTGKELDRVCAFYNEHCEAVEKELKVLQILKDKKVDLQWFEINIIEADICITQIEVVSYFFEHNGEHDLTLEEMQQIVEWLKEE